MASTLHQFRKLPAEIRLIIWRYAIRPDTLGAQFFTIFNQIDDVNQAPRLDGLTLQDNYPYSGGQGDDHILAAPPFSSTIKIGPRTIVSDTTAFSWVHSNPSAYLWDTGLWTACRESRYVMEEHYGLSRWIALRRALILARPPTDDTGFDKRNGPLIYTLASNSFMYDNETWRFHLQPYQDLIVLSPFDADTIAWLSTREDTQSWQQSLQDMPFVSQDSAGLSGFANIAMEFTDPEWRLVNEEDTIFSIVKEASHTGNFMRAVELMAWVTSRYRPNRLWLIDYNLKRQPQQQRQQTPGTNVSELEPVTFHGLDRVFIEVTHETCEQIDSQVLTVIDLLDSIAAVCGDQLRSERHLSIMGTISCDNCQLGTCQAGIFNIYHEVGILIMKPCWFRR